MTTDPFAQDEQVIADEDILIERPDLGPGCHTLVVGGTPIPPHLMAMRPTHESKRRKRS